MTPEAMAKTLALDHADDDLRRLRQGRHRRRGGVREHGPEEVDVRRARPASRGPTRVLASNTSTLDIDEFAQASGRPAQVIGHHFFSPANVMKLLEIVRGRETSQEVIATSLKLAQAS